MPDANAETLQGTAETAEAAGLREEIERLTADVGDLRGVRSVLKNTPEVKQPEVLGETFGSKT